MPEARRANCNRMCVPCSIENRATNRDIRWIGAQTANRGSLTPSRFHPHARPEHAVEMLCRPRSRLICKIEDHQHIFGAKSIGVPACEIAAACRNGNIVVVPDLLCWTFLKLLTFNRPSSGQTINIQISGFTNEALINSTRSLLPGLKRAG